MSSATPDSPPPNLLFPAPPVPSPPDMGARIRPFHLLRFLAKRARVHLACLADEPTPKETLAALEGLCERVAVVPVGGWSRWARALLSLARGGTISEGAFRVPALAATLRRWTQETRFDVAFVSASSLVPYVQGRGLRDVPAVVDLVDVASQKWVDCAAASRPPRSWLYRLEGRRLRRLEQSLPGWARAVTLVGEAEAGLYREFCAPGPVHAITNGVDLDYYRPVPPAAEPSCV